MLAFFQSMAHKFYPLRLLFLMLFVIAVCCFGYLLFVADAASAQRWQLTAVFSAIFSLLLWLWAVLFNAVLPPIDAALNWQGRFRLRLRYALRYVLVWLLTALLLVSGYLGVKVLKGIIAALLAT